MSQPLFMKKAKTSLDYKTYVIQLKSMKKHHSFIRSETAKVWNDVNKLHKYIRQRQWKWPSSETFQKYFKKEKAIPQNPKTPCVNSH